MGGGFGDITLNEKDEADGGGEEVSAVCGSRVRGNVEQNR